MEKIDKVLRLLEGLSGDVGDLKSDVGTLKSDVGFLKGEMGAVRIQLDTARGALDGLRIRADRQETLLRSVAGDVEQILEKMGDHNERIEALEIEVRATK